MSRVANHACRLPCQPVPRRPALLLGLGVLGLACSATQVLSQPSEGPGEKGITPPSIATSLPGNGDPGGIRERLAGRGITYEFIYTNDILANVNGGTKRGAINQAKLEGGLSIDFGKSTDMKGLSLYANVFQIDGTGRMRRDYVGGINTIAAIEAVPTLRLSELWFEQKLLGTASVRIGQLAVDSEFFFSSLSTMFLQSDWPTIAAVNLPSGGAAYPLATPGVRIKYDPTANASFLLAVLNGDPAGPGPGDPEKRNPNGLNFRLRDPAFVIGEAQFRHNMGKNDTGLAGQYKFGAWGHFGAFNDQRIANDGGLLADPGGSHVASKHTGNGGVYGVFDQQLYRPRGGSADGGVSVYTRISASPSDRNLISFHLDGGIIFSGFVPRRPDDKFGAGFVYARFSDRLHAFDQDLARFGSTPAALRDFEANLELNYQAQIVPGWLVQPNVQYIWHPSGNAQRDATVVGVRSFLHY